MTETRQPAKHFPIRSYVLRQGRMTGAQQRALTELWPRYGLSLPDDVLDLTRVFGNANPVILEIGFGNGEALADNAALHPELNYLGIEVHGPGVGALMLRLAERGCENVRILQIDAMELLRRHLAPASLSSVMLFFPDPWPKKKHHKRRIVTEEFARLVQHALAPGGQLHMATDWEDYARQMLEVLSAAGGYANQAGTGNYAPRPASRPLTKFERRGQRLGHEVRDLIFVKRN
ncbi:MAG: tRNA (guanosine(46)-N7)-methyltransferase TrmB [Gammaproteobacteria bacterium]|nr:tRNA (guanosine(46)-N7)-methyltransferase TrmB [Gammaproteobacteria bacterium]